VIAAFGHSGDSFRPSYFAAKCMIEHGRLFGGLNGCGVNTKVISAKRPQWLP
jgi:hypothetical protein